MAPPVMTKEIGGNIAVKRKENGLPGNNAVFSIGLGGERLMDVLRSEETTKNIERIIVVKPGIQTFRIESAGHSLENPDGFPIRLVEISPATVKPPIGAFGPEVGDREFWPNQKPI